MNELLALINGNTVVWIPEPPPNCLANMEGAEQPLAIHPAIPVTVDYTFIIEINVDVYEINTAWVLFFMQHVFNFRVGPQNSG